MHSSRINVGKQILLTLQNDGEPEIMSADMFSNDPYILKCSFRN